MAAKRRPRGWWWLRGDAARRQRDVPTRQRRMEPGAPRALGDPMAKRKGRRR